MKIIDIDKPKVNKIDTVITFVSCENTWNSISSTWERLCLTKGENILARDIPWPASSAWTREVLLTPPWLNATELLVLSVTRVLFYELMELQNSIASFYSAIWTW